MPIEVVDIRRNPVKGLSAETLDRVGLSPAKGPPHDHEAGRYWYVSVVNAASLRALEAFADVPVDPVRFRANIYIDGAPAWAELDWAGREIAVGGARLRVARPIERCAATNVNPATAERDLNLPRALKRGFGHLHMGVYAVVTKGGEVAIGDAVEAPCAPAASAG